MLSFKQVVQVVALPEHSSQGAVQSEQAPAFTNCPDGHVLEQVNVLLVASSDPATLKNPVAQSFVPLASQS